MTQATTDIVTIPQTNVPKLGLNGALTDSRLIECAQDLDILKIKSGAINDKAAQTT